MSHHPTVLYCGVPLRKKTREDKRTPPQKRSRGHPTLSLTHAGWNQLWHRSHVMSVRNRAVSAGSLQRQWSLSSSSSVHPTSSASPLPAPSPPALVLFTAAVAPSFAGPHAPPPPRLLFRGKVQFAVCGCCANRDSIPWYNRQVTLSRLGAHHTDDGPVHTQKKKHDSALAVNNGTVTARRRGPTSARSKKIDWWCGVIRFVAQGIGHRCRPLPEDGYCIGMQHDII